MPIELHARIQPLQYENISSNGTNHNNVPKKLRPLIGYMI